MEPIKTNKAPGAVGPYSQGMKTENFIYTSGQLPISMETGEMSRENIEKETKMCLNYLLSVVEAGGSKLENIIKVTIFIKDMNDFPLINQVYEEFFDGHKPARSCVQVAKLPKDANIEIEAIAQL